MSERISIQDIINRLSEKRNMDRKDAELFVKGMFGVIEEALATDKYVKIKGLGTFKLIEVEKRESINVNTGERIEIQGHTKISFTPDNSMKDLINKPFSHFETVILNENTKLEDLETEVEDNAEKVEEIQTTTAAEMTTEKEVAPVVEEIIPEEKETTPDEEKTVSEEKGTTPEVKEIVPEVKEVATEEEKIDSEEREIVPEVKEATLEEKEITSEEKDITPQKEEIAPEKNDEKAETRVASAETTAAPVIEEKHEKTKKQEKKSTNVWIIVVAILLALCIAGGIYWLLQRNSHKPASEQPPTTEITPSQTVEEPVPATAAQDSVVQEKDTTETTPVKETMTVKETTPVKETTVAYQATNPNAVTLADTVEYDITGTKATYTLQEGETLVRVAVKFYGTKDLWPYIVKYNKGVITNADRVPIGTTLHIPELTPKGQQN